MCKTYRDCFLKEMTKKGETFKDVIGYVGNGYDKLDEPVLEETDSHEPEKDISLHVYTENWVYSLRSMQGYFVDLHWYVQTLPLPNNPEFKRIVFSTL